MRIQWRCNVEGPGELVTLFQRLADTPQPFHVVVKDALDNKRGVSQSDLFHAWMGQIAKATYDTPSSVKADCHIRWGIPIFRAEDQDYSSFISTALGGRHRGKVKDMIEKGFIPCTSLMSKPPMSRYMDSVWQHYAPHVRLWDPQELKWRDAA